MVRISRSSACRGLDVGLGLGGGQDVSRYFARHRVCITAVCVIKLVYPRLCPLDPIPVQLVGGRCEHASQREQIAHSLRKLGHIGRLAQKAVHATVKRGVVQPRWRWPPPDLSDGRHWGSGVPGYYACQRQVEAAGGGRECLVRWGSGHVRVAWARWKSERSLALD